MLTRPRLLWKHFCVFLARSANRRIFSIRYQNLSIACIFNKNRKSIFSRYNHEVCQCWGRIPEISAVTKKWSRKICRMVKATETFARYNRILGVLLPSCMQIQLGSGKANVWPALHYKDCLPGFFFIAGYLRKGYDWHYEYNVSYINIYKVISIS